MGPTDLIDSHGRILSVDDEVSTANLAHFGIITKITPVLHPQAPEGLLQVRVIQVHDVLIAAGQPSMELTRVQTAAERYAKGATPVKQQAADPNDNGSRGVGKPSLVLTDQDKGQPQ